MKKASEYWFLMVLFAALLLFGTAAWIIFQNIASEKIRWVFDIFSAFLLISLFFWLLVLEGSIKNGN